MNIHYYTEKDNHLSHEKHTKALRDVSHLWLSFVDRALGFPPLSVYPKHSLISFHIKAKVLSRVLALVQRINNRHFFLSMKDQESVDMVYRMAYMM